MFDYSSSGTNPNSFTSKLNVPRGGESQVVVVSESPVLVNQHFKTRSVLCSGDPSCPLCFESNPIRSLFFVAVRCNGLPFFTSVPATIPPNQLELGSTMFIRRARRNNRITVQHSFLKEAVTLEVTTNNLWKLVLRIYKVNYPRDLNHENPDHCKVVAANVTRILEQAAVKSA